MENNKILTFILPLILVLALFNRLYNLNSLPPSLFSDEVDAAYQAKIFNIFKTDYFGNHPFVHFHSFSDWRTPGLIYSIAFLLKLGISTDMAARLPSVIFGILSIIIFYLIVKLIFNSKTAGLISAFIFSVNPWHIHYSRTAFEVSGMLFFLLLGIYFWLRFIRNPRYLYLVSSILTFSLTPYFYSTAKLFLPLILLSMVLAWPEKLLKNNLKFYLVSFFIGLVTLFPLFTETIQGKSGFRFSYINIFSEPTLAETVNYRRYEEVFTNHPNEVGLSPSILSKILNNRFGLITEKFISNYFSSFSTEFLFLKGDGNIRHGFGNHGLLYVFELIFLVFGFTKIKNNTDKFFLYLLIFSPISFSLTRDSNGPHSTRLILMLPSLIYFIFLGLNSLSSRFRYPIILLYIFSFIVFFNYYNFHYPQLSARLWHTGMEQAVKSTTKYNDKQLYFSDKFEPFMPFFLYYYPYLNIPKPYHINNSYFDGASIENRFFFGHIYWNNSTLPKDAIYIAPKSETGSIGLKINILDTINKSYINQEEFVVFTIND